MKKVISLGDKHSGRQTQYIHTDTSTYIKKPREYQTEVAFSSFCQGLERLGLPFFSCVPALLTEGDGWHTEAVVENLPTSSNGIHTYYLRAGMLLFICYLFSSTDMHCENLIASGDVPVLVDMETLLSGKRSRSSQGYNLSHSVMCSHLLCNFMTEKGAFTDVSGFSGQMADLKNIPHMDGKRVYPWEKKEELLQGFETAYRLVLSCKDQVAELLHLFDNCNFRQLLRPTQTYYALITGLDAFSDDKREASITSLLSYAYERDLDANRIQTVSLVLQEEVRSVLAKEIPLFYTRGNDTSLYTEGAFVLPDYLELSPVDYAIKRLDALHSEDLENQKRIIELALLASTPLCEKKSVHINAGALLPGEVSAKRVDAAAISSLPSVFCGLELQKGRALHFISNGFSLYTGLSGILCMYAALYRKTEKKAYLDKLFQYYNNLSEVILKSGHPILLNSKNSSLGDGITGIISSLLHMGELIEDERFMEDAKHLIQRIHLSEGPFDTDYLNGAGALPVVLEKAKALNGREISMGLYNDFKNHTPKLTGFAHGASGLLLSLFAMKSQGIPVDKAQLSGLLSFENQWYSGESGNWQDLRSTEKVGFMSGWCSGAPGIGMARERLLRYPLTEEMRTVCERDLSLAKTFLQKETSAKRDSLCCGCAARLMAASRLGISQDTLYERLRLAEQNDTLIFYHPANTADTNVSLMQGLSGVAYALAMYQDPLSGGMLL